MRIKFGILFTAILITLMTLISCGGDDPPDPGPSFTITSVNGDYFKAVMGTSQTDRALTFEVKNSDDQIEVGRWVHFQRVVGDGQFTIDSAQTDSNGRVTTAYLFNGEMGNAELSAFVRNNDTVTVSVRADILKPGPDGQGQYIHFNDTYGDVISYNGEPDQVDLVPNLRILNYEASLGVVVVVYDDTSFPLSERPVTGVIVNNLQNNNYQGKTKDSLGIGSTYGDVIAVYERTQDVSYSDADPQNPAAWKYHYARIGITVYTDLNSVDTLREIYEFHVLENVVE